MKITLEVLLLLIMVILFGYILIYSADILLSPTTQQSANNQVCFGSNCFSVELAKTNAEREKGLMNRSELDQNKGMLFIFNKEDIYPFWMKDTLIPLDMIWIDQNNKVVFVAQNVQPCKSLVCPVTFPAAKAKYVLEINAGLSNKSGIKIGDLAKIEIN